MHKTEAQTLLEDKVKDLERRIKELEDRLWPKGIKEYKTPENKILDNVNTKSNNFSKL